MTIDLLICDLCRTQCEYHLVNPFDSPKIGLVRYKYRFKDKLSNPGLGNTNTPYTVIVASYTR